MQPVIVFIIAVTLVVDGSPVSSSSDDEYIKVLNDDMYRTIQEHVEMLKKNQPKYLTEWKIPPVKLSKKDVAAHIIFRNLKLWYGDIDAFVNATAESPQTTDVIIQVITKNGRFEGEISVQGEVNKKPIHEVRPIEIVYDRNWMWLSLIISVKGENITIDAARLKYGLGNSQIQIKGNEIEGISNQQLINAMEKTWNRSHKKYIELTSDFENMFSAGLGIDKSQIKIGAEENVLQ